MRYRVAFRFYLFFKITDLGEKQKLEHESKVPHLNGWTKKNCISRIRGGIMFESAGKLSRWLTNWRMSCTGTWWFFQMQKIKKFRFWITNFGGLLPDLEFYWLPVGLLRWLQDSFLVHCGERLVPMEEWNGPVRCPRVSVLG